MDPISMLSTAVSVVGMGVSLFGGASAASDAKQAANIQSNIAGKEGELEGQRHTAMELSARRQSLEIVRNNQRNRAMAVNNAVSQGANLGSGLQGGMAQIEDQGLFNLAGVNQNLQIGEAMFGINQQITQQKQQLAQVQGQQATDQGLASMGGAITKAGPIVGNIAGSFGGTKLTGFNNLFGGGSPSGYGA